MKDNSLQIQKRLSALFLFLFLGVCAPGCGREEPEILLEDTEISGEAGAEGDRADASEEADVGESGEPEEIWVDIAGEVQSPGVYRLESGARLYELVEAAGGFTEAAAPVSVNQARILQDGEQVRILSQEEYQAGVEPHQAQGTEETASVININTATEEELTGLDGIGPSKAAAIVAYREEQGAFGQIEEITKVNGIGQSTFEKIKEKITVS